MRVTLPGLRTSRRGTPSCPMPPPRRRSRPRRRGSTERGSRRISASPHPHAIAGLQEQLLPRLHTEHPVPGVDVPHRIAPVLGRRMAVGDELLPQRRLAQLLAPALPERDEEQLVAREALALLGA